MLSEETAKHHPHFATVTLIYELETNQHVSPMQCISLKFYLLLRRHETLSHLLTYFSDVAVYCLFQDVKYEVSPNTFVRKFDVSCLTFEIHLHTVQ